MTGRGAGEARREREDGSGSVDYRRVERAIGYVADNFRDQPTLEEVADHLGMSRFHVQRLFTRWAGVSPKRFLQYVTLEHAKGLLRDSGTVLEASWGAGLSGSGRLHDLFVTVEAMTPGEYRRGGRGLEVVWGIHPTPFGDALFAVTERGLTSLTFVAADRPGGALDGLADDLPGAALREDPEATAPVAQRIFGAPAVAESLVESPAIRVGDGDDPPRLHLHLRGTNFQLRVWEALLRVPPGAAVSYGDVAEAIGRPDAARAVGRAVGRNPVAVIIPCHRVLRRDGGLGGYRWGEARKRALLGWEAARRSGSYPPVTSS